MPPKRPAEKTKGENFYRDGKKVSRTKMLSRGHKAIRDRNGKIIQAAPFQKGEAETEPGRVQPDRRWFGNTRVISQNALDHFRESLAKRQHDPYSVVLKQNKLPMSLLQEPSKASKSQLATAEPFDNTFGPKAQRKRPRLNVSSFDELAASTIKEDEQANVENHASEAINDSSAGPSISADGDDDLADAPSDYILKAGTSKRIWAELYKVIDSSDVILHVLDARDPLGTQCESVEKYLAKEKRAKKLVYILNKCDLVPGWVSSRWIRHLSQSYPTIAFHASINNSFGKGSLIRLLRQFSTLFSDRKQISIGFIGYPNVGKSSIINTLKHKKVCSVAPIPGETKVWQYITLMRRVHLIDCPGIVPPSANDTDTQKVLKGVVRVEHLSSPSEHIVQILERVKPQYIKRTYGVQSWKDTEDFLTQVAVRRGKLKKGGEAELDTVAKMILNDWVRGKVPFFEVPPGYEENPPTSKRTVAEVDDDQQNGSRPFKKLKSDNNESILMALNKKEQKAEKESRDDQSSSEKEQVNVEKDEEDDEEGEEEEEEKEDKYESSDGLLDNDEWSGISESEEDEQYSEAKSKDRILDENVVSDIERSEDAKNSSDEDEFSKTKEKNQGKEPRMTTSKKRATNYYTHANVKNKNRDRKAPKNKKGSRR